jgi:hypothetical protein
MSIKYFAWLRAVEDTCAWDIPVGVYHDLNQALREIHREWIVSGARGHEWYVDTFVDGIATERRSIYENKPVPLQPFDPDSFDSDIRLIAQDKVSD